MDDKTQALYNARAKQIDIDLQQELIKIDEEYSRRGIPNSGMHLRAKGLDEIKANARKAEVRAELEIRKELPNIEDPIQNHSKITHLKWNGILLYEDGRIEINNIKKKYKPKGSSLLILKTLLHKKLTDEKTDNKDNGEVTKEKFLQI